MSCSKRESYLGTQNEAPVLLVRAAGSADTSFSSAAADSLRLSDRKAVIEYRLYDEENISGMHMEYLFSSGNGMFRIDGSEGVIEFYPEGTGIHSAEIRATDNFGLSAGAFIEITAYDNLKPVPHLTFRLQGNDTYLLDASGSYDRDGDIAEYTFDYGAGVVKWGEPTYSVWTNHIEENGGVTLTVKDDRGEESSPVFFELKK